MVRRKFLLFVVIAGFVIDFVTALLHLAFSNRRSVDSLILSGVPALVAIILVGVIKVIFLHS